jgi:hypothetical protein
MKFLNVQLPPFSRHLIPLRSKYSSQNPVLKHPQSILCILKDEMLKLVSTVMYSESNRGEWHCVIKNKALEF